MNVFVESLESIKIISKLDKFFNRYNFEDSYFRTTIESVIFSSLKRFSIHPDTTSGSGDIVVQRKDSFRSSAWNLIESY